MVRGTLFRKERIKQGGGLGRVDDVLSGAEKEREEVLRRFQGDGEDKDPEFHGLGAQEVKRVPASFARKLLATPNPRSRQRRGRCHRNFTNAEGHAETREREIMAADAKHEIVDAGAQLCPLVGRWRGGYLPNANAAIAWIIWSHMLCWSTSSPFV